MVAYEQDLKKINRTSVKLRGQEGYLAGLDVMHELHCLVSTRPRKKRGQSASNNYVRQTIYDSYYAMEDVKYHNEHLCL
ncbi:hypothetical protein CJF30_00009187 [Rutstroemia sp. NJR-2017a BBW]|nr:hypothetical protein CJF30_00009187 [Rutstroemia sp. NJR-2017a BBW]